MPTSTRSWMQLIPSAFARATADFGVHPSDKKAAVKMLHAAMRAGVTQAEIMHEARLYLSSQEVLPRHIEREMERILKFSPNPLMKQRMSRAWLVTSEHPNCLPTVVSLLKTQRPASFVRKYIEQLYIDSIYTDQEKLVYAVTRKHMPDRADFLQKEGPGWRNKMACGTNPRLYARIVTDVQFRAGSDGMKTISWVEIEDTGCVDKCAA